jgi:hypothetical protein
MRIGCRVRWIPHLRAVPRQNAIRRANAFEISDIQQDETEGVLNPAIGM